MAVTPLERAPTALTGRDAVYLKREDVHELGAFKWRGALPALERYSHDGATGVVTASTGNHGAATAWAAQRLGLTATVYVPEGASRTKLAKLSRVQGRGRRDRRRPRRGEGAGASPTPTARAFPSSRTAPSRRSSTATRRSATRSSTSWARSRRPSSCPSATARCSPASAAHSEPARPRRGASASSPAGAPVMASSWRAGRAVDCDLCDTIADGLAVRVAIPLAVDWLLEAADDMLEVSEAEIASRRRRLRRRRHPSGSGRCCSPRGPSRHRSGRPDRARRHRAQHRRRAARPLPAQSVRDCPWTRPL